MEDEPLIIIPEPPAPPDPVPVTVCWIWGPFEHGRRVYHCYIGRETPGKSLCGRAEASSWETKTPGAPDCPECLDLLREASVGTGGLPFDKHYMGT